MCAIVGSKNKDKLVSLVDLNSQRGSHSYSFSLYNYYTKELKIIKKGLGTIDNSIIDVPPNNYGIVHIQAPTTDGKDISSIHPAVKTPPYRTFTVNKDITEEYVTDALWHNGILKPSTIEYIREKYTSTINGNKFYRLDTHWDTRLLMEEVLTGYDLLNNVDGTFSCLFFNDGNLVLFRNQISPMFFDSELNISSVKFEYSGATVPDMAWKIDFSSNMLVKVGEFKTVENPYYFGE